MLTAARKQDMRFGRAACAESPVSQFIPYTRLLNASTLKTREGYLLKIVKLEGAAFETADQGELNHLKNMRAAFLRGLANSRFALYHHIIRKRHDEPLEGFFENDWCRELDRAYRERLSARKMFLNEQYITLIRRPASGPAGSLQRLTRALSSRMDKDARAQQEAEDVKALDEACANLLSAFARYKPRLLGFDEMRGHSEPLSFLSYLVNLEPAKLQAPRMSLASYLPAKRLSFGRESFEVRGMAPGDTKLGAILSLKEYAGGTGPGMLDALLRLPHEFVLTQSFAFVDRQGALSAMRDTQRKLAAGEDGAASLERELDEAIDDVASGRSCFGEHHLSIAAFGESERELEKALSEMAASFTNLGIVAVREDLNLEPAFWAQLPGNFSYIARRSLISNANFAAFASLHGFPLGKASGNHWGSAVTKLETTSGTPYWFNFHERDVGNFTVIGPTGTGKTVLLTFLHAQAQRLGVRSVYFDKDRGAEIYIRAAGGDYTSVKAGVPTGLNPLQLPGTAQDRAFLRDWVKLLVCGGKREPSPRELGVIADAVEANFEVPPMHRRLSAFAELLAGYTPDEADSLASRLSAWHGGGERAWLFDNGEDTLALGNRTIAFDLTSILDDPQSRTPWLMYIFYRIEKLLSGERLLILLDEGWKLLDDPAFSARIKDWMKTIRKQNGIVGFATQSARDAINSSVGDTVIEQSPTQIFLPNARASERDYCEGFGLSQRELKLVRDIPPGSRCFLVRHGNESVLAKLDLSGLEDFTAVLSGRTESVALMHRLIDELGQDPALWLPRFQKERKYL